MDIFRNNQRRPKFDFKERLSRFLINKSPLNRLILINIGIYLLIWGLGIFFNLFRFLQAGDEIPYLEPFILDWFGGSSNFVVVLARPWTMITSLFIHFHFLHIAFNMIMLWFSGKIFLYFFSAKKIYAVYLLGGIAGHVFFILSAHLFPVFSLVEDSFTAIGASAGVLAILIAAASKAPNYQLRLFFIGNLSLKWIAIIFVIIDIVSLPYGNSGGHFAHLGGALFGFLYVYFPKLNQSLKRSRMQKVKPEKSSRPKTDEQYNAERTAYRKKVDAILDKIAKSGYQSLSEEEKEFLFQTSNKKNW